MSISRELVYKLSYNHTTKFSAAIKKNAKGPPVPMWLMRYVLKWENKGQKAYLGNI